eukprot:scaffold95894_cov12-Prasinocladus_malaysianus.AAC.1
MSRGQVYRTRTQTRKAKTDSRPARWPVATISAANILVAKLKANVVMLYGSGAFSIYPLPDASHSYGTLHIAY